MRKRLVRVLAVLRLIEAQPRLWTRGELARRFGVSERQTDNDLRLLRLAGYDLRRHRGGYVVYPDEVLYQEALQMQHQELEKRRARNRERSQMLRERRRAAGLCLACGKPTADHVRCPACHEAMLARQRRKRRRSGTG